MKSKAFWVVIALITAAAIFFLGDMLDAIAYPQYAFAGSIILLVVMLLSYYAGTKR